MLKSSLAGDPSSKMVTGYRWLTIRIGVNVIELVKLVMVTW
jgi:hypothetical protein